VQIARPVCLSFILTRYLRAAIYRSAARTLARAFLSLNINSGPFHVCRIMMSVVITVRAAMIKKRVPSRYNKMRESEEKWGIKWMLFK